MSLHIKGGLITDGTANTSKRFKYGNGQTTRVDDSIQIINDVDGNYLTFDLSSATTGATTTIATNQTQQRTLTLPNSTSTLSTKVYSESFANKTITSSTNNVAATGLLSTGGNTIRTFDASEPTSGQVLRATSNTSVNWQTISGGGSSKSIISATTDTITITSGTYELIKGFLFPGSTAMGATISKVYVLYSLNKAATVAIRLQDTTNNQTIAESTTLTSQPRVIADLGTISNVPTGLAKFEFQGRVVNSGGGRRLQAEGGTVTIG